MLNYDLAGEQGLSPETISQIEGRQAHRKLLGEQYKAKAISAGEYKDEWGHNEYILQELWGFPLNSDYHMFWEMEGCTCPRMDNRDTWGSQLHYYAGDCPLHGAVNEYY